MIAKVMPQGRAGVPYNIGKTYKGRFDPRVPMVLLGDPDEVQALIDSLSFANNETSVVLTFEKTIARPLALRLIDEYEQVLLPGMVRGRDYKVVWTEHKEYPKDPKTGEPDLSHPPRTGLHGNFANVHLPSGKRLQPYFDPADRRRVENWQEIVNAREGFASPKDPERARDAALNLNRLPKGVKEFRGLLHQQIVDALVNEEISTRADLIEWLDAHSLGIKVARVSPTEISITAPGHEKNIRLKGGYYVDGGIEQAARARDTGQTEPHPARDPQLAKRQRDLEEGIRRRRDYLRRRYENRGLHYPAELGDRGRKDPDHPRDPNDGHQTPALEDVPMGSSGRGGPGIRHGGGYPFSDPIHRPGEHRPSPESATDTADQGTCGHLDQGSPSEGRAGGDRGQSQGAGRGNHEGSEIDDFLRHRGPDDPLRSSAPHGQDLGVEKQNSNSSTDAEPLTYGYSTNALESQPNGSPLAGLLAGFLRRSRETDFRLGVLGKAALRAIQFGFRFGQECVRRLAEAALDPITAAFNAGEAAEGVGARISDFTADARKALGDLQTHGHRLQFDESRIPNASLTGPELAGLVILARSKALKSLKLSEQKRRSQSQLHVPAEANHQLHEI